MRQQPEPGRVRLVLGIRVVAAAAGVAHFSGDAAWRIVRHGHGLPRRGPTAKRRAFFLELRREGAHLAGPPSVAPWGKADHRREPRAPDKLIRGCSAKAEQCAHFPDADQAVGLLTRRGSFRLSAAVSVSWLPAVARLRRRLAPWGNAWPRHGVLPPGPGRRGRCAGAGPALLSCPEPGWMDCVACGTSFSISGRTATGPARRSIRGRGGAAVAPRARMARGGDWAVIALSPCRCRCSARVRASRAWPGAVPWLVVVGPLPVAPARALVRSLTTRSPVRGRSPRPTDATHGSPLQGDRSPGRKSGSPGT